MTEFLLSDDRQHLGPVLDRVKRLHSEYRKGVQTLDSESALRELHGLLDHRVVKPALDNLLRNIRLDVALLNGQRAVEQRELDAEVSLAKLFDFSPGQVRRYIERTSATTSGAVETSAAKLRTSADLQTLIDRLHGHLRDVQASAPSGFLASQRHKRVLKEAVDDAIFCIGVIVADGLQTAYFRLSYTVALATFVRLVPNE